MVLTNTCYFNYIKDQLKPFNIFEEYFWEKLLLSLKRYLNKLFFGPLATKIINVSWYAKVKTKHLLTMDNEYSHHNRENSLLTLQMQLSKKVKTFCCILTTFLESTLNFERFFFFKKKKKELHSLSFSEITDSERCGYLKVTSTTKL